MPSLLALDCSTFVGWAFFRSADDMPYCRTWRAPSSPSLEDNGRRFSEFRKWVVEQITVLKPDVLVFESPILIGRREGRGSDEAQIRLLVGLASMAEVAAYDFGVRCMEVNNITAKVRLAGTRWAKKNEMIAAATNLGYSCADSHQADACGIALVAYDTLRP